MGRSVWKRLVWEVYSLGGKCIKSAVVVEEGGLLFLPPGLPGLLVEVPPDHAANLVALLSGGHELHEMRLLLLEPFLYVYVIFQIHVG